jgi:hypothetical protein
VFVIVSAFVAVAPALALKSISPDGERENEAPYATLPKSRRHAAQANVKELLKVVDMTIVFLLIVNIVIFFPNDNVITRGRAFKILADGMPKKCQFFSVEIFKQHFSST